MIRQDPAPIRLLDPVAAIRCIPAVCLVIIAAAVILTLYHTTGGVVVGIAGMVIVAFLNGANDLPKSVATLIGSGILTPRRALYLGAGATLVGGVLALFWSGKLLSLFSSGGITVINAADHPYFPLAVIGGAATWVLLATKTGLPVSTTHALVGASIGGALVAVGAEGVRWGALILAVLAPLLAGPLLAGLLGFGLGKVALRWAPFANPSRQRTVHLISAVGSSAARALNDAPKIVGVGLLSLSVPGPSAFTVAQGWLIVIAAVAMASGGLWASRAVNRTLAFRVAQLESGSGMSANLTNSMLVGAASAFGLPLSTTQISGSALVGATKGLGKTPVHWGVVRSIVGAWVVTVPGSAALAALFWWVASSLGSAL